jgi:WD40 repeat protein
LIGSLQKPGFRIGASFRVAFSADGRYLATVGKRSNVWDVAARKRCGDVKPFSHESEIDVSPDSGRIAIKNTRGDVAIYDIDLVSEQVRLSGKPYGEGDAIRFSPGSDFIIDSSWRGDFVVRDSQSGGLVWKSDFPARGVAPRRDRTVWLFATDDGIGLQRWPFWDSTPVIYAFPPEYSRVARFALADSSDRVVVGTPRAVEIWMLDASLEAAVVTASWRTAISGTADAVAWHPTEAFVAHAGGRAASVLSADLVPVWHEEFAYPSDVAFSTDGSLLAVGDWSKGAVFALSP